MGLVLKYPYQSEIKSFRLQFIHNCTCFNVGNLFIETFWNRTTDMVTLIRFVAQVKKQAAQQPLLYGAKIEVIEAKFRLRGRK